MENILLKKSFQDIYGNIYALYEYIIVWCSIQKICKYISKNTVNLELIRGAMDCWRDEKKKKKQADARAGMESLASASIFTHSCIYEQAFRGEEKS